MCTYLVCRPLSKTWVRYYLITEALRAEPYGSAQSGTSDFRLYLGMSASLMLTRQSRDLHQCMFVAKLDNARTLSSILKAIHFKEVNKYGCLL